MPEINWVIDALHSEITFKVRHLMITTVTGYFRKFDLQVETVNENFDTAKNIEFTADINSIDTHSAQRDTHLKSGDFFNAEEHSELTYTGKNYEAEGNKAKLYGELTIRGVTRPVTVDVEYSGTVVDPFGHTKAGFIVNGEISRKDFGLVWNAVTEAGSVVISDEIKIHAEIQLIKQA